MTFTLQSLGAALITAGLMSTASAAPVSLSAVIDFENLSTTAQPTQNLAVGDGITTQYTRFGLEFTGPNVVNCSRNSGDPVCTAPLLIGDPPHVGKNFLMNKPGLESFSVKVLDGFSLSTLKLDIARNNSTFFIKFFDTNNLLLASPIDEQTGSDFRWSSGVDLGAVSSAVRRIEFGGSPTTSFAIDYMSFDYVTNSTNVPEPATLSIVALALAGVGLMRRQRA